MDQKTLITHNNNNNNNNKNNNNSSNALPLVSAQSAVPLSIYHEKKAKQQFKSPPSKLSISARPYVFNNRYLFKFLFEESTMSHLLNESGSLFHSDGSAALQLTFSTLVRDIGRPTTSKYWLFERRLRR